MMQAQVVHSAPFDLLLGRPFFAHCKARLTNIYNDNQVIELEHPMTDTEITVPTKERGKILRRKFVLLKDEDDNDQLFVSAYMLENDSHQVKITFDSQSIEVSIAGKDSTNTQNAQEERNEIFFQEEIYDNESLVLRIDTKTKKTAEIVNEEAFKYKKVVNRIKLVSEVLLEEYRIMRKSHSYSLKNMPTLSTKSSNFELEKRITQKRKDTMNINSTEFLLKKEEKLA